MSRFLGQCGVALSDRDLAELIRRFAPEGTPLTFQGGCFHLGLKLPMGFGVTLVAIPQAVRGLVRFHIPIDQIRGDRTGGLARMIAGGLWGAISGKVEKEIAKVLVQHGLPRDTVALSQIKDERGSKVGCLDVRLPAVNEWLARQPGPEGVYASVDVVWATETSLNAVVELFQHEPLTAPRPAPPLYN